MNLLGLLVLLGTLNLEGFTGFHLARGGWQGKAWQTPVGLASLGVVARRESWGSATVRFLFFDLLHGSRHTPTYTPYLQEASVTLNLPGASHLVLGHQPLSFKDGFFLTDIGDGLDAVRWIGPGPGGKFSLFYVLQGHRALGDHPTGDFAGLYWTGHLLDLYGALRTDGTGLLWLGSRLELQTPHLRLVAEGIGLHTPRQWHAAGQVYLRGDGPGVQWGAGVYALAPRWQKPTAYPSVMDQFYNGWTAFGEALNWVVLPMKLAPWVSSAQQGDPYAVYWPDPHNLWVVHLTGQKTLGDPVSLRLDLFGYGLVRAPNTGESRPFLGPEVAMTTTWSHQGVTVGLSVGLFLPRARGATLLETRSPAWSLRLWSFAPFGMSLKEHR